MRNKIVQKLISILLSFVLIVNIGACLSRFTASEPLPESKLVLEAGHLQAWIAWYQWIKAGGTWWLWGAPRPTKPTSKPADDELL